MFNSFNLVYPVSGDSTLQTPERMALPQNKLLFFKCVCMRVKVCERVYGLCLVWGSAFIPVPVCKALFDIF